MRKFVSIFIFSMLLAIQSFSQCACCAGASTGSSMGDFNGGMLTLPKKKFSLEAFGDYRGIKKGEINHEHHHGEDPEDVETPLKSMLVSSVGGRYGLTQGITVSALLPYVFLHTDLGNDKGLGDLILLGTFNVYNGNQFKVGLQAGVELPTGIQKGSNFDNTTVVVGSGSYDPMGGILLSWQNGKIGLRGNALYKHTSPGFEKNYYGSLSVQNLSLTYKLMGGNMVCSTDTIGVNSGSTLSWSIFGGYSGEWLDKITEDGIEDDDSGYYAGFAVVGTTISLANWNFPLAVSAPVINQFNGDQNGAGWRVKLGVVRLF